MSNQMNRVVKISAFAILVLAFLAAIAAEPPSLPFGAWTRLSTTPIISPQGDQFESAGTFNPSVVKYQGKFVMLYRAQDRKGTSSLGYATSDDGVHFTRRAQPVLLPEMPYEKGGGVEDPRLADNLDSLKALLAASEARLFAVAITRVSERAYSLPVVTAQFLNQLAKDSGGQVFRGAWDLKSILAAARKP